MGEHWEQISKIVEEFGCKLFDLEVPKGDRGVLKVYLCNNEGGTKGVGHDQCAGICKRINDLENLEELAPGECTIEVSTPGINRHLNRPEHFKGAVGERIRIVLTAASAEKLGRKKATVRGILRSVENELIQLEEEETGIVLQVTREELKDARVDFRFE